MSLSSAREPAGLALGLAAVVIFGLTLPASRTAVLELSPVIVGLGRAVVAAAIAGCMLVATRARLPERRYWTRLALAALGIVIGFPLLSAIAMQSAPAAHGGVVLALLPLATAAAAVIFAGERPSPGFWLCGVAGAAAVTAFALRAADSAVHMADLLLVAATASAATGYAISGDMSRRMGGWLVISWALVFALPVTLPATLYVLPEVNWSASWQAWAGFFYVALFSQLIGFFFWNRGMALAGVAKVGQTQLLQTFVTLLASSALLGETIDTATLLFAAFIVAIVAAGQRMRVARQTV